MLNTFLKITNTIALTLICFLVYNLQSQSDTSRDLSSIHKCVDGAITYSDSRINILADKLDTAISRLESRQSIIEQKIRIIEERRLK
ncbi:hypothetical protein D3C78_1052830 [compost metagenome]